MKRLEFPKTKSTEVRAAFFKYFGFEGVRWWIYEPNLYTKFGDGTFECDRFSILLDCTEEEYKKLSLALMKLE